VLVQVYDGFMPIVHADVYRLGSTGELDDLELPAVAADGVLLVEWGGAIESGLPPDHLVVRIEILDEARRRFTFEPVGSWTDRSLKDLAS
jgi:tRNA A37 threonylcarbamoyladenosine biosynthesis protein TsaE